MPLNIPSHTIDQRGLTYDVGQINTEELYINDVAVTATAAELNLAADQSGWTQGITSAGAIALTSRVVEIVGPATSTYAVTLAAPTQGGIVKVITMLSTTSTNAVTLALTNVVGGSQASSASFDAAGETLVLVSNSSGKWVVLKEVGVTLS